MNDTDKLNNARRDWYQERRDLIADLRMWRAIALWLAVILGILVGWVACAREPVKACQPDPVFEQKVQHAAEYISQHNRKVDAEKVARMIVQASREARLSLPADYKLLLALARFESTFYQCMRPRSKETVPDCVGTEGERGLLQVHPVHFTPMRQAGLDPDEPYDCLLYGALIISWEQAKGRSLHAALRPWTVRTKAISEWRTI